ncbi:MAG: CBS domain-containing protein [Myxococcales bacterium]|nr:CBS domain-containing protein [Myxococcales bacterium]
MKIRDIMTTNLVTVNQNADLDWANDVMEIANIRHIPVVRGERLVGLISRRDLLRTRISALAGIDPDDEHDLLQSVPAHEVMTSEVVTLPPDADLRQAIETMVEEKIDSVLVVDDAERLAGIVTSHDIIKLAFAFLHNVDPESVDAAPELRDALSQPMRVAERMAHDVISVAVETDLNWVDDVFELARIRHLPVVEGRRLVGLVTQRDLLLASISSIADVSSDERREMMTMVRVGDIMNREITTVRADSELSDALRLMLDRKFGCLPVIDEQSELVGLLTDTDMMKLAYDYLCLEDFPGAEPGATLH